MSHTTMAVRLITRDVSILIYKITNKSFPETIKTVHNSKYASELKFTEICID